MPPFTSSIAKYGGTVVGVTVPEAPATAVQPETTSSPAVFAGHAAAVGRGGVEEGSEGTGRRSERASVVRGRAYSDIRTCDYDYGGARHVRT